MNRKEENFEENNNEKRKISLTNLIINTILILSLILFGAGAYNYFFKSNNVSQKIKESKINPMFNEDYMKELRVEEQKMNEIMNKQISIFKNKQYKNLEIIRNNIYYDIKRYDKHSKDFAEDINSFTSQFKIIWKSSKDMVTRENETAKYIESIYYKYFFSEEDIKKIVANGERIFKEKMEKDYNLMLVEIVNEVDMENFKRLQKKDIEKLIQNKLGLSNNYKIDIDKIKGRTKMNVGLSFATRAVVMLSEDIIRQILTKVVSRILVTTGTKSAVITGSSAGGPVVIGGVICISIAIDLAISNFTEKKIVKDMNKKIKIIALEVSNGVYNEMYTNLKKNLDKI
ncbi:MAG: hypothetical protein KBA47_00215 [Caldisericia bacterium]|nr:hypothetical protein [Caldisericia bacterium]